MLGYQIQARQDRTGGAWLQGVCCVAVRCGRLEDGLMVVFCLLGYRSTGPGSRDPAARWFAPIACTDHQKFASGRCTPPAWRLLGPDSLVAWPGSELARLLGLRCSRRSLFWFKSGAHRPKRRGHGHRHS